MPIVVKEKDISWWQIESKVFLQVEIPHVSQKNSDILTSNKYLKISCLPHIFEAVFWDEIDEERSKCMFNNGCVLFELPKKNIIHWEYLTLQKSKEELKKLKCEILNSIVEERQKKIQQKAVVKSERDRLAVKEQIDYENREHQLIQNIRDEEKEKVLNELYTWKSKPIINRNEKDNAKKNKDIFSNNETVKIYEIENETTEIQLPSPRTFKSIQIDFTPRHFPTPSRESTKAEELEWLKKQTDARRASGFVEEDLRPEEHDPEWCLRKGDTFMTELNYIGAVSAYSHGIKLSPKMAVLYLNRSKAHIKMKNYHKVIEDASTLKVLKLHLNDMGKNIFGGNENQVHILVETTDAQVYISYYGQYCSRTKFLNKALELMVPAVDANASWRAEAFYNRGRALIELHTAHLAVGELECALRLEPGRADTYGPELAKAVHLAAEHEAASNISREMDLSDAPTVLYK